MNQLEGGLQDFVQKVVDLKAMTTRTRQSVSTKNTPEDDLKQRISYREGIHKLRHKRQRPKIMMINIDYVLINLNFISIYRELMTHLILESF